MELRLFYFHVTILAFFYRSQNLILATISQIDYHVMKNQLNKAFKSTLGNSKNNNNNNKRKSKRKLYPMNKKGEVATCNFSTVPSIIGQIIVQMHLLNLKMI